MAREKAPAPAVGPVSDKKRAIDTAMLLADIMA